MGNPYSFLANNPWMYVDPWGLCGKKTWGEWFGEIGQDIEDKVNVFGGAVEGMGESVGMSVNSMIEASVGLATWDWDRINAAYEHGVLGQSDTYGPGTKYGTRGALAISGSAMAVASAALASETAAAHGLYRVGAQISQRAQTYYFRSRPAQLASGEMTRWFSPLAVQQTMQHGSRMANTHGASFSERVKNYFTTFRYVARDAEVVYNWVTGKIIHFNPFNY